MQYTFSDLVNIIAKLRAPGGCPWDAEQTHESIKKNMIEEAYESLEAIDSGIGAKMADELGDLLLQIVLHAQIGKEYGEFTIDDVIGCVSEKMIRRHPHVFGEVQVENSDQVLVNWEKIKKQENGAKTTAQSMETVSRYLPALMRSEKLQGKAAKVGFDWQTPAEALEKVKEETAELAAALRENTNIREEIGDLLFAVVKVSRLAGVDPEDALTRASDKFTRRFADTERLVLADGKSFEKMTLSEMDAYWDKAKKEEKKQ